MTTFLIIVLIVSAVLAEAVLVRWLRLHPKAPSKRRRGTGANANWEDFPQAESNALLPTLLNMFMSQMMQSQQDQHQHESEQLWMMQESVDNHPTVSDHTWDF
ncbi:MAG: hypothetical protein NT121_15840 [Chloroflexi bacterium]|nr:hypothetical protein [Chloroflexota bacterium]